LSDDLNTPTRGAHTPPELRDSLPVQIGQLVGGYRLDRVLGQGSAGSVYLGTHTMLGRRSAIKVLSRSLSRQPEVVRRFFHEARIVNDIQHANIVDIVDFIHGGDPAVLAYVMEYIDGPSLAEVLIQRRMTQTQVANVCMQLSSALQAAHDLGIVHRDLKPDNVLLLESPDSDLSIIPSVKILDFGIAKIEQAHDEEEDNTLSMPTEAGVMMGTPRYMAPEQISNENVSAKADVYALTELFYEMLTGQPVFAGSNMAVFQAKLSGQDLPLNFPSDVTHIEYLTEMVRDGLAREPNDRLDLAEFCQRLSQWLQTDSGQFLAVTKSKSSESAELTEAGPTMLGAPSSTIASGEFESLDPSLSETSTFAGLARRAEHPGVFMTILVIALSALGLLYFLATPEPPKVESAMTPPEKLEPVVSPNLPAPADKRKPVPSTIRTGDKELKTASPHRSKKLDSRKASRTRKKRLENRRSPSKRLPARKKSAKSIDLDDPMRSTDLPQW
jgi:serine/threonine protein kinase